MATVKRYPVRSERWLFGLESMYEKCRYMLECEFENMTEADMEKWESLADECERLLNEIHSRGTLTGKDFGRMKEITYNREYMRYSRCLEAGMPEYKAREALRGI